MTFQASIHSLRTGRFLMQCSVEGHDLRTAEDAAIATASMRSTADPWEVEVRHLHQCAERHAAHSPVIPNQTTA
jgi:hypothetical protein